MARWTPTEITQRETVRHHKTKLCADEVARRLCLHFRRTFAGLTDAQVIEHLTGIFMQGYHRGALDRLELEEDRLQ